MLLVGAMMSVLAVAAVAGGSDLAATIDGTRGRYRITDFNGHDQLSGGDGADVVGYSRAPTP